MVFVTTQAFRKARLTPENLLGCAELHFDKVSQQKAHTLCPCTRLSLRMRRVQQPESMDADTPGLPFGSPMQGGAQTLIEEQGCEPQPSSSTGQGAGGGLGGNIDVLTCRADLLFTRCAGPACHLQPCASCTPCSGGSQLRRDPWLQPSAKALTGVCTESAAPLTRQCVSPCNPSLGHGVLHPHCCCSRHVFHCIGVHTRSATA